MNKKILVLAFVSAAFFFGCSADGSFSSNSVPPAWDGEPSTTGPSNPHEPVPTGGNCSFRYQVYDVCIELDDEFTAEDCIEEFDGTIVSICP